MLELSGLELLLVLSGGLLLAVLGLVGAVVGGLVLGRVLVAARADLLVVVVGVAVRGVGVRVAVGDAGGARIAEGGREVAGPAGAVG